MIGGVNVLLTGALGMVGQHALAELLKAGHRVRVMELPTAKNRKLAGRAAAPGLEMVWATCGTNRWWRARWRARRWWRTWRRSSRR